MRANTSLAGDEDTDNPYLTGIWNRSRFGPVEGGNADSPSLVDRLAEVCRARGIAQLRVGEIQSVMGPLPVFASPASSGSDEDALLSAKRERDRKQLGRTPNDDELRRLP